MSLPELENLVRAGVLKKEPPDQSEIDGLLRSGRLRLKDAHNQANAWESRFDLAYNAAHALALSALRWHGFRSEKRYVVFQSLEHTLGIPRETWRILDKCHQTRNLAEYEGYIDTDEQLLADLLAAAEVVLSAVSRLGKVRTGRS